MSCGYKYKYQANTYVFDKGYDLGKIDNPSIGDTVYFRENGNIVNKSTFDGISWLLHHQGALVKLTEAEIVAMGFCKCQKGIENTSGATNGETSVTYPTALDVLDAPSLTPILGSDGIVFDVSIKSRTITGFVAYAKDSDGMPYQGNGKIKWTI